MKAVSDVDSSVLSSLIDYSELFGKRDNKTNQKILSEKNDYFDRSKSLFFFWKINYEWWKLYVVTFMSWVEINMDEVKI